MKNKNNNIWAPWRIEYLKSLESENDSESKECLFCRLWANTAHDKENLILWRTERCMVLFNRFPYTCGHLLITPASHVDDLSGLDETTMLEMMILTRDAQKVLARSIKPHGFNVGINISRCAGAGLPDHIHLHLVPRWDGDTNFMGICGNTRVISQALDELYDDLHNISEKLNLPTITKKPHGKDR